MDRRSSDAMGLIMAAAKDGATPESELTVSEWADSRRILSSISSPEPGPWRTRRVPYMREIQDALSPKSHYEFVWFMKGSQIAATEGGLNFTGTIIEMAPGPMLHVMPTTEFAKDYSKLRLDSLFETPSLRGKVHEPRDRDGGNSVLLKEFPGGYISLVGTNSPAALAGKPIRYLFCDEIDRYKGDVGGEGDPLGLAVTRTRNYAGKRKAFFASTPTIAGRSRIEQGFNATDQRRFFVPCPHCEFMQALKWAQIRWDRDKPDTAHYVCEACDGKIYNYQKTEMLEGGEWRAMNPAAASRTTVGFHLSSLYSPVGWLSWEECVKMFLDAKDDRDLLKVFINTVLGETFEERGDAPEWELLEARSESYERNTVPAGGLFLTCGVDIQKDRFELEIVAWGRGKESWSVDYRVIPGGPETAEPWKRLDDILNEHFAHESGATLPVLILGIDSGYAAQHVYTWARRYPANRIIVVKGGPGAQVLGQPRSVEMTLKGKRVRAGVKVWPVGSGVAKMELYGWLRLKRPEDGESYPPGFVHFPQYDSNWFKMLTAENLKEVRVRGGLRYEWELMHGRRNEALDCRVYARAAAAAYGIDRFTDERWKRFEADLPVRRKEAARREAQDDKPTHGEIVVRERKKEKRNPLISRGFRGD